jgi:class 3 adenylate cyclase
VPRVVFVIADLAGYTALTEAHGGDGAATTVARYRDLAERALADGARIVEQVGDELLIVAGDARAAMMSAVRIRAAVDAEPRFPGVRVGIADGPVVERDGRYFGTALNLTARLAARAGADEIFCTAAVAEACRDLAGVAFRGLGALRFKNVPTPVDVFTVVSQQADHQSAALDPVCRMRLDPGAAPARLPFGNTTHYFCSLGCARAFAASPESYVTS